MLYEKFLPTLQDFAKRYPNFYADISALTLPNRMGMLLHLRRHPELHDRLLFGTDYPLSVFHLAAWGRVGLRALRNIVRTTNRFDRQVAVCGGLGINFRSFGALIASSSPDLIRSPGKSSRTMAFSHCISRSPSGATALCSTGCRECSPTPDCGAGRPVGPENRTPHDCAM